MIWGFFSWYGVSPLYHVNGIMDQIQYREILETQMLPFATLNMPEDWSFQHDNDLKHTAKSVKKWLGDHEIKVLNWPAMSPDLNPIENLWNEVERKLSGQKFPNSDALFIAVQEAWQPMPKSLLESLISSMSRRLAAVKKVKGYCTKY